MDHINGPLNCIIMEGKVNNITKKIVLFMDVHNMVTKCDNINNIDIDKYIFNFLNKKKNKNKSYDLFLEIPGNINVYDEVKFQKFNSYMTNMRYLFSQFKNYKIQNTIRLHYIDIRQISPDIIKFHNKLHKLANIINTLSSIQSYNYSYINKLINEIYMYVKHTYEIITDTKNKINKEFTMDYMLTKILNKYENKQVKNKINDILQNIIDIHYKNINDLKPTLNNKLKGDNDNLIYDKIFGYNYTYNINYEYLLIKDIEKFHDSCFSMYIFLMDLYFIRRVLDKDYVTNCMVFTGSTHTANYIYILIKYFDFKITYTNYSLINNLEELNNFIININIISEKNILYSNKIHSLFTRKITFQCINLKKNIL